MAEGISGSVAWRLRKAIKGVSGGEARQSGTARVTRRDSDGTVWLRMPGSTIDTPVTGAVVANVEAGDVISYAIQGGRVTVAGNASDPSVGERTVGTVRRAAQRAQSLAKKASDIATATGQHFWHDDNGAHVSTEKDNPTGERNILMNSLGILLRQGATWLASFSDSAVAFYDGLGNAAANVVAQFGADGAVIGRSGESHMELDYHSMQMVDKGGFKYFEVQDMRDEEGHATIVDTFTGDGHTTGFNLSLSAASTDYGVVVSDSSGGTPVKRTIRVEFPTAPTDGATITVTYETTSQLAKAYTLGHRVGTTGYMSVVTGHGCTASGSISHAEGSSTASGLCSHSEGTATASGNYSHAGGYRTTAAYDSQTAIGRYNSNKQTNLLEVGNGTSNSSRSNAFEVDRWGNVTAAGRVSGSGPKVLWSGASYMNASQTVTLSETLANQPNGIVLHWQPYSGGAQNNSHHFTFVPKTHGGGSVSSGLLLSYSGTAGRKILTIATSGATTITGDASNVGTHTAAGISLSNSAWVLTEVLGV